MLQSRFTTKEVADNFRLALDGDKGFQVQEEIEEQDGFFIVKYRRSTTIEEIMKKEAIKKLKNTRRF